MSIGADLIRGHTDAIILAQLLKKDSYGYEINKTISRSSEGEYELKEATLYTAFKRLEDSGQITSIGRQSYGRMLAEWRQAKKIIDTLMETEETICGNG